MPTVQELMGRPQGFTPEQQAFLRNMAPQLVQAGLLGRNPMADLPQPTTTWVPGQTVLEAAGPPQTPPPQELAAVVDLVTATGPGITVGRNAQKILNPTSPAGPILGSDPNKLGVEISDSSARLSPDWQNTVARQNDQLRQIQEGWEAKRRQAREYEMPAPNFNEYMAAWERMRPGSTKPPTVGSVLDHEGLYAAYPDLANMPLSVSPAYDNLGSYRPGGMESISLNTTLQPAVKPHVGVTADEVMFHELQHAIQEREGWTPGGNINSHLPSEFLTVARGYQDLVPQIAKPAMDQIGFTGGPEMFLAGVRHGNLSPLMQERLAGYSHMDDVRQLGALKGQLEDASTGATNMYKYQGGEVQARATQAKRRDQLLRKGRHNELKPAMQYLEAIETIDPSQVRDYTGQHVPFDEAVRIYEALRGRY